LIFASTKKFAAIVTRSGKIVAVRPLGVRDGGLTGVIDVPTPLDYTLYGHYGDWFAVACGAVCLVTAVSERIRRAHEKSGRLSA
jgi:apolipoprotein N-acyltransferase